MDTSSMNKTRSNLIDNNSNSNVNNVFVSHNGFVSAIADIELMSVQADVTYTSLKDLLPSSSPMMGIASPKHNSSWHEIPIKNPLVKHAALAYLQPMSTPPDAAGKGFFRTIRDTCTCTDGIGCMDWLRDVAWRSLRNAFTGGGGDDDEDDDEEDDEDDEEEEEYVEVD